MKICVFGAGAIGGYMAVELARAGQDVSVIARGAHLEAIRRDGLKLLIGGEERVARLACDSDPAALGPQDYVILAIKAHQVAEIAARMAPLFGPDTAVVTAMNGVPYWYFYGLEGAHKDRQLESVDPGGLAWTHIEPRRVIGCVVYPACEIAAPGIIRHVEGDRFPIGEPDGSRSPRSQKLSEAMIAAGLRAPVRPRIRDEIWVKLWGNLSFNPVSALTGGTLEQIASDPATRAVIRAMMVEARAIGEALGVNFGIDVDRRIEGARAIGAHKTSMLQDLERGRAMEIDALVGSVQELGRIVGLPCPTIDTVLALVKQRARLAGCYK